MSSTDVDTYVEKVCLELDSNLQNYDRFAVSSDIKQYIYNAASEKRKNNDSLSLNNAVEEVLVELGSPAMFAENFLEGLANEKRTLYLKLIVALIIFLFPLIALIIAILTN